MDLDTQQRLDSILEDEVQRGFRIKELPADLQAQVKGAGLTPIGKVRITRMNPRRRRNISAAVQTQYHKDLANPAILSDEQLMALVEKRGEWTPAKDKQMEELQARINRAQNELYLDGISDNSWHAQYLDAAARFREFMTEAKLDKDTLTEVLLRFDRMVEYSPDRQALYTERYAESQGLKEYSVDRDSNWLRDRLPHVEAGDCLDEVEELRDRLIRFIELKQDRTALVELQVKHAKIFADSAESRRDATEEMARVFYCVERVDEKDVPLGPLVPTLDELWDLPDDVIQWLIIEQHFFANGIPDETRDYLETFGFIRADRGTDEATNENGVSEASDASPAPQNSKDASEPAAETPVASSAPSTPTS